MRASAPTHGSDITDSSRIASALWPLYGYPDDPRRTRRFIPNCFGPLRRLRRHAGRGRDAVALQSVASGQVR